MCRAAARVGRAGDRRRPVARHGDGAGMRGRRAGARLRANAGAGRRTPGTDTVGSAAAGREAELVHPAGPGPGQRGHHGEGEGRRHGGEVQSRGSGRRLTIAQYCDLKSVLSNTRARRVRGEESDGDRAPLDPIAARLRNCPSSRLQGDSEVNGSVLPEDVLRDAPSYTPRPHELADLELLLSGAYAPLTGFLGRADLTALRRRGRLADGTPWPVAVTLEIPAEIAAGLDLERPAAPHGDRSPTRRARRSPRSRSTDVWPTADGRTASAARYAGWATAGTARSSACAAPRRR